MNKAVLATLLALAGRPVAAETLHDAVAAAYAGNPVLAAARARQDALGEAPEQARAAGRLTAALDAGGGYDRFGYGRGLGGTASAQLPIWTGGRVRSAVRAANGDVAAGAEGVRDTAAAVLEQVVAAYADVRYDEQAVLIAQADIALLDHEVADSRARFTLGNATRTDVARLDAQRAAAVATLAEADRAGVAAAELALKGVRAEYAFALRSTLDILVADESLRGAQLALARAQGDALIAQAALLRATGRLDEDAF